MPDVRWLGLKAQMIQKMTPRPAANIQRELSLLTDGLFTALDELREISHGIHPAVLSEAGLGPALQALARRSAVPVELDLDLGSPPGQQAEATCGRAGRHMLYLARALSGLATTPDPVHPRTWACEPDRPTTRPCCTESRN